MQMKLPLPGVSETFVRVTLAENSNVHTHKPYIHTYIHTYINTCMFNTGADLGFPKGGVKTRSILYL